MFLRKLFGRLKCFIGMHDVTCKHDEGIDITKEQMSRGLEGLSEYCALYCKRDGCSWRYTGE
jgi:hypothetical protein